MEEAAGEAIRKELSLHWCNFHGRKMPAATTGRPAVFLLHLASFSKVFADKPMRKIKKPLSHGHRQGRGERTQLIHNPNSPLVQASAPHAVRDIISPATLGKPLIRECLLYP
jgi:hypothetical protein